MRRPRGTCSGAATVLVVLAMLSLAAPTMAAAGFCDNCSKRIEPVCGLDDQTYTNDCIRQCIGVPLKYKGECDDECYPYADADCNSYDWNSQEPVCVWGLTFTNLAEAACAGMPLTKKAPKCYQQGVCDYTVRNGQKVTFFQTPPGRGESVAAAAANTAPLAKTGARYAYSEALTKAMLFFDSMVSGKFEAKHKRLTWRKNSCKECYDKKYKKDLSGGFYEAGGSYLKFPIMNAYAVAMLSWTVIEEAQGLKRAGIYDDFRWKTKWGADYLMACEVADYVYAGMNGNSSLDFSYYGPPEWYDKFVKDRPVGYITKAQNRRGSEILADAAAALAAASFVHKDDAKWSKQALAKAIKYYDWARKYPGSYMSNSDPVMKMHAALYPSNDGYIDDLAWAALWIYKVTGKSAYLNQAKAYYAKTSFNPVTQTFEIQNKRPALSVLMSNSADAKYRADAEQYLNAYLSQTVRHTNRGLAYNYHWGGGRFGGNVAWLALTYAKNKYITPEYANRLRNYALFQVNYYLGDSGRSWLVGFGKQPDPWYIWHKVSYNSVLDYNVKLEEKIFALSKLGPWLSETGAGAGFVSKAKLEMESSRNPQRRVAYGVIMTPLKNDNLVASRRDYTYAEPTIEYPCGLIGALAHLTNWYSQGPYRGKMTDVLPF